MSPAEDALLLLRLAERHLGSLRGTLDPATLADEDWGFLAQQTVEKLLKALLVLNGQEPPRSHSLAVASLLLDLDDFAVLARYDAEPTPLPGVAPGQPALRGALEQAGGPAGGSGNAATTLPGTRR